MRPPRLPGIAPLLVTLLTILLVSAAHALEHPDGHLHHGRPLGKIVDINSIPTYITGAPRSSNIVLFLSDIYGLPLPNTKLLADEFGAANNLVLVPDLFAGDPVPFPAPAGFDMAAWRAKHNDAAVEAIIDKILAGIKQDFGTKTVTATGYCFGGRYVFRLLKRPGVLTAGFTAHPSSAEPQDLRNATAPLSIAAAEVDAQFPRERRGESEDALAGSGQRWEVKLYGGTAHGFAVRGQEGEEWAEWVRAGAREQAVEWFAKFAKKGGRN